MTSSPALNGSLTHEPDRFSDAAWDLLLSGQDVARRWRHEQLDVEHLIQVLFTDPAYRRLVERLPLPIDALLDRLEDELADQPSGRGAELFIGDDLEQLLDSADAIRRRWNGDVIDLPEVLMAIGADPRIGADLFAGFGLSADALEQLIQPGMDDRVPGVTVPPQERSMPRSQPEVQKEAPRRERMARVPSSPRAVRGPEPVAPVIPQSPASEVPLPETPTALESYGRDLTEEAEAGSLDPVIGRDSEIRNLIKVLSRRSKNNPVLIGEPGVGKTAIAELLAQRIVAGEVPESLQGLRLVALDLGALIAGAKFRGQFEERLRSVLEEVSGSDSGVVLFIDELHTVVGSDRSSTDAGSLLKPALAGGDLRCIGAEGSSILQRFAALVQIALTGHVTGTPIQGHGHGNHHAEGQQRRKDGDQQTQRGALLMGMIEP